MIFSGPINTEEQRKAVPEELRKKLEQMDKTMKVKAQEQLELERAKKAKTGAEAP